MALHESALEALGLAPMWVRRGIAQSDAVEERTVESSADVAGTTESEAQAAQPVVQNVPAVQAPARVASNADADAARPVSFDDTASTRSASQQESEPASLRAAQPEADAAPAFPDDDFAWFDDLPTERPSHVEVKADSPAQPAIDTLDWTALEARVSACKRCRLCEKRTNTVFGVGDREADWMLIGEAPGENEDKQGEPFVGQAGKLLDNMLRSLDLARGTNVYIANVIKCRPPGNRNPEPDEVARCEPYLQRQVALVKPKLIVALGRFAAQSLLKTEASISSLRGRVHEYEGVPVIVTYHPAYLLRSLGDKAKSWQDLCLARDTWLKAGSQGEGDAAK